MNGGDIDHDHTCMDTGLSLRSTMVSEGAWKAEFSKGGIKNFIQLSLFNLAFFNSVSSSTFMRTSFDCAYWL